ncbi:pseudouridine synthase [Williamsia deligens]|uniref:RNA pseudouridylate synthase n=1 Tax=Williamsia deligens TaxID=321325 RepID=A0ABW3GA85_9NOCA|nr:pseudouridine synthase [Williamsia deligens]MCP2193412.1 tRNA pseudouridine32 synthase / 23S rRNA pseudouridine746 synthase [Williamsia deligens]
MSRRRRPVPLPARDGVDATRIVPRVDALAVDALRAAPSLADLGDEAILARFADGEVVDGAGRPLRADDPVPARQPLWMYRDLPVETPVPFELTVLHLDDDIVVVDKPHFLATMPRGAHVSQTALVRLRRLLDDDAVSPAHRLDRLTAGVLLFTRRPEVRRPYQELFADRRVEKEYRALAPSPPDGLSLPCDVADRIEKTAGDLRARVVDGPVNARSRIEVLGPGPEVGTSLYRLLPLTGRTHQLRLHMARLGVPIVDDPLYPDVRPDLAALPDHGDFSRPLRLVAHRLAFDDPITGRRREFTSPR